MKVWRETEAPRTSSVKELTILIPALNEESQIEITARTVIEAAEAELDDYQIIMINDCSEDRTGSIMDGIAAENPRVHVLHQSGHPGLGKAFAMGLNMATMSYITLIAGDNAFRADGIRAMFAALGQAEMVVGFRTNQSDRSKLRSTQSLALTMCTNLLFRFSLRDVHGMFVIPVSDVRLININGQGYSFHLQILVTLLRMGLSYVAVPIYLNSERKGNSHAIRLRTYIDLAKTLLRLRFSRIPKRVKTSTSTNVIAGTERSQQVTQTALDT